MLSFKNSSAAILSIVENDYPNEFEIPSTLKNTSTFAAKRIMIIVNGLNLSDVYAAQTYVGGASASAGGVSQTALDAIAPLITKDTARDTTI